MFAHDPSAVEAEARGSLRAQGQCHPSQDYIETLLSLEKRGREGGMEDGKKGGQEIIRIFLKTSQHNQLASNHMLKYELGAMSTFEMYSFATIRNWVFWM